MALGTRLSSFVRARHLGPVDPALGSAFGAVMTVVSFRLVGSLLVHGPIPAVAGAFQRSRILKTMDEALPKPPDVYTYVRHYLDDSGFPQVFVGFPRAISAPREAAVRQAGA